ncbi:MAG: bifunctional UDP-sugar hydrolase/5'-nucleotidase [Anaerolineae bacterium]|nr:MAG: bifunctional UDP-sugar hydrolase/5'-nucleotidase [Anaerolineae bacterium]
MGSNRKSIALKRLALLLIGAFAVGACSLLPTAGLGSRQTDKVRRLVILYTNDEHGWMGPYQNTGGSAGMAYKWQQREGLTEDGPFLVLSGGDMWTGHALSTVWEGESMTDVMNNMGYDAAAIGNHDFDFGLEALRERADQAEFPFLSANIRESASGEVPDFAVPYFVTEVNGIKVGVIGLTTPETKVDTQPAHVADLDFLPYADVLPDIAKRARDEGAELLLIVGHVCAGETRALAPIAAQLDIRFIGGGHCHQEINEVVDGVRLVESGFFNRGYTRVDLLYDTDADQIVEMETEFVRNKAGREDPDIAQLIDDWRARTDEAIWEVIGFAEPSIDRKSPQMAALLLEPWLKAWPSADVALASSRYVQQDLFPGDISPSVIIGLLSTANQLVEADITGRQLIETIETHRPLMAGIAEQGDVYRLADGRIVDLEATYRVLIPEALYAGGNYYEFFKFDPNPTYTGIDWRQPPLDWIRSVGSTEREPINGFLSD